MTAYSNGIATDHIDLWTKLIAFLTTDPDLTSAGETWSVDWSNGYQAVMKGTGLSGTDEIYVGLKLNGDASIDSYWLELRGMSGALAGATDIAGHINTSKPVGMYLDSGAIRYWFVANGRRFVVVVKISTVYQACYGGLFLPYTTPVSYAYPLFVGGTRGENAAAPFNWRSLSADHTMFFSPSYTAAGARDSSAWMMDPAGQWLRCWNNGDDPGEPKVGVAPEQIFGGLGASRTAGPANLGYDAVRQRMTAAFDGSYPLVDISLVQAAPSDETYGVLDGCYRVTGINNASENLVAADGANHLVVQNVFRTGAGDYFALALE